MRPAAEGDGERLVVEPPAAARVADDIHLAEEVHADLLDARALARLAAAAGDVEREPALAEAARCGLGLRGQQVADHVRQAGVGGGIRTRRPADRRLVDVNDLADRCPAQPSLPHAVHELLHEARLPGARHAGDDVQRPQEELDVEIDRGCGATRPQRRSAPVPRPPRHASPGAPRSPRGRRGSGSGGSASRRRSTAGGPLKQQLAPVLARRPDRCRRPSPRA